MAANAEAPQARVFGHLPSIIDTAGLSAACPFDIIG
jgi:hypothetical protein